MSEVPVEGLSTLNRTPQQLIVAVLLALLIAAMGIVMIFSFAAGGLKVDSGSTDAGATAVAERLKPVGSVLIGEGPGPDAGVAPAAATPAVKSASAVPAKTAAAGGAGAGKKLYDTACAVCHAAGIAGAPKTGDKTAWKPRIATGQEALYNSAVKGKNAMPAKGGLASASDADVKAAVNYMLSQGK
jgi:cytochrome c5